MCSGYYRYDQGYAPAMPGSERFAGPVIHPQQWPEDLDYDGKRVVVIGSGATAVTLVPAMAERAAHVTMLQRSPSYVMSLPGTKPDRRHPAPRPAGEGRPQHRALEERDADDRHLPAESSAPEGNAGAAALGGEAAAPARLRHRHALPAELRAVGPAHVPGAQRRSLRGHQHRGRTVVTDRIETFTEKGIKLVSGGELEADIIITATGINLQVLGGLDVVVDGEKVDVSERLSYKGCMIGGVPNLAMAIGYTNASWTLKSDLISRYVMRLLNYMDASGYRQATPRPGDASVSVEPLFGLTSGYVTRSIGLFPKQGAKDPWRIHQNYLRDIRALVRADLHEGMEFSIRKPAAAPVKLAA